jgi:hypothetical protein
MYAYYSYATYFLYFLFIIAGYLFLGPIAAVVMIVAIHTARLMQLNTFTLFVTAACVTGFYILMIITGITEWNEDVIIHHSLWGVTIGFVVDGLQKTFLFYSVSKPIQPLEVVEDDVAYTSNGTRIGITDNQDWIELTDKAANQHTLILGTTGSGKTVTVCNVVESAIHRSVAVIYIDGKGDDVLGKRIRDYAKEHGRGAYLFSMYEKDQPYNPLATGGFTSKKDRIIELREGSEAHYKKIADGYLQMVFKVLDACRIETDIITLAEYLSIRKLKMLIRQNEKILDNAQALMDEVQHHDHAADSIERLVAEIRNIASSELAPLLHNKDKKHFTLDQVLEEKSVAYFSLPALVFPSMSKTLGKLIINDIKATIAKRWSDGHKSNVYVIFDEFSVFAGEQVLNVINMGRSAGINAILCTQSLSDIASARSHQGDHFINQVVANCNHFIMHRQNSPRDASYLSSIVGKRQTQEYSLKLDNENERVTANHVRNIKDDIIDADQIKRLQTGEAYFFSVENTQVDKIKIRMSHLCG